MAAGNRHDPTRTACSESQLSLMEFMRDYPDDTACLEHLWRSRCSPDGEHAECPKCEQERVFRRYETAQGRQSWTCTGCGHHVHPTAGTIFHKSSTSLHLWFFAIYMITSTRCGVSAKMLEREIGVSYHLKPSIKGTYRRVSHHWLQGYLNEFVWRRNARLTDEPMFDTLVERSVA